VQDKGNIEELFKETFSGFEEPVRPELWQNISAKINAPAATPANSITGGAKGVSAVSKIAGLPGAWIAGAAIVALSVTGYYLYNKDSKDKTNLVTTDQTHPGKAEAENTVVATPTTTEKNTEGSLNSNAPANDEKIAGINKENKQLEPQSEQSINTSGLPETSAAPATVTPPASETDKVAAKQEAAPNANTNIDIKNTAAPITISPAAAEPKIQILAYPVTGKAPLTVRFTFSGSAESAEWNFGDGKSEAGIYPLQHTFDKPGSYEVSLLTTSLNGVAHTETKVIEVYGTFDFGKISNIITPNQDGRNDVFRVEPKDALSFEGNIYDKSGRLIFQWFDAASGWNGKLMNGQDAEAGTYFYTIFATGADHKRYDTKGQITIMR
jgi:gliding motility-associated-like protein